MHGKSMGPPVLQTQESIEQKIVEQFVTESFVEKEFTKIINEEEEEHSKLIPKLLGRIWYELVNEESWNILKAFKNPTIDFKILNRLTIQKIKEIKKDLF
jgi:hypothetical protein